MIIKKFKNGNFHVTAEGEEMDLNMIEVLCNSPELDFDVYGNEALNTGYYYILVNYGTRRFYNILRSDLIRWHMGGNVKLIGYKDDALFTMI
jgi:hypothetical protein